jgi:hypothetical protein
MSPSIIFRHEDAKAAAIRRIQAIKPDQEHPLALWIGPYKKIRSLEANALYWRLIGTWSLRRDTTGIRCMFSSSGGLLGYVSSKSEMKWSKLSPRLRRHLRETLESLLSTCRRLSQSTA